jgi:hypothetical protein
MVKRLKVLSSSEAKSFFQQWPDLLRQEELVRHQSSLVERTFQETPTRHAFSSVSTELHELKQAVATTNSQLSIITRRTEPFSPSKCRPHRNSSESHSLPELISSESRLAVPFFTSELESGSGNNSPIQPPFLHAAPAPTSPLPQSPRLSATATTCPSPVVFTPSPSNLLTPLIITVSNHTAYHILPLSLPASLGQPPPRTQQDLILPPCSAFASAIYPPFTTRDCTWQYIFDRITNPSNLWLSYAPGSLGDYPDIKSLWQAWDEGTFVIDVGRTPALRLIDARWGNLRSQETRRGKFPSWRPTNNEKVCTSSSYTLSNRFCSYNLQARKIWSNFYFFVHRIEDKIKSGMSSNAAVSHFDNLRNGRSLSQLHRSLQTKKRKHNDSTSI